MIIVTSPKKERMMKTSLIILFLLLLVTIPASAQTTRCIAISSPPIVISKPGVYCLNVSINYKLDIDSAIIVAANNVIIDLNGHTINGLAAGPMTNARGISATNRQNITIKNGSIRGFNTGIFLHDTSAFKTVSQRHIIEDIHVSNSRHEGMHITGSDIILRRNRVVDTGGSDYNTAGIIARGRGLRLQNNDVIRTHAPGLNTATAILVDLSNGAIIENNRIDTVNSPEGSRYGLRVNSSKNTLATGNRFSSVDVGIFFTSSTGKYMNNLTINVNKPFLGGTAIGINN